MILKIDLTAPQLNALHDVLASDDNRRIAVVSDTVHNSRHIVRLLESKAGNSGEGSLFPGKYSVVLEVLEKCGPHSDTLVSRRMLMKVFDAIGLYPTGQ